jgi:hypothetical protein
MAALSLNSRSQVFRAEHGLASHTPLTSTAGSLHPWHSNSVADLASSYSLTNLNNFAYWLMSKSARKFCGQVPVSDMNISVTEPAGPYSYQNLISARLRSWKISNFPFSSKLWNNRRTQLTNLSLNKTRSVRYNCHSSDFKCSLEFSSSVKEANFTVFPLPVREVQTLTMCGDGPSVPQHTSSSQT